MSTQEPDLSSLNDLLTQIYFLKNIDPDKIVKSYTSKMTAKKYQPGEKAAVKSLRRIRKKLGPSGFPDQSGEIMKSLTTQFSISRRAVWFFKN